MDKQLNECLNNKKTDYILPFFWQHGEEHSRLLEEILAMKQSGVNSFCVESRTHEQSGKTVNIAGTSCRMVSFETLHGELRRNGLSALKEGITSAPPDFPMLMYAVVKGETQ